MGEKTDNDTIIWFFLLLLFFFEDLAVAFFQEGVETWKEKVKIVMMFLQININTEFSFMLNWMLKGD